MRKIYKAGQGLGLSAVSNGLTQGNGASGIAGLGYVPTQGVGDPGIDGYNTFISNREETMKRNRALYGGQSSNSNMGSSIGPGIISEGLNAIGQPIFQNSRYANNSSSQLANDVRKGLSDAAIKSGNPYAMAIGAATKVVDGLMDATGLRSDNFSKKTAEKVGVSGAARFLNNAMNFLPGNPLALGGKAISEAEKSEDTEKVRGAFANTLSDIDTAGEIGGSRVNFMLSGKTRRSMDDYVKKQNERNELLSKISRTNTLRKQSDYSAELSQQNFNRYSGSNYQGIAVGKQGMKIEDTQFLKDGGTIGVDSSVIPEGALHKELNHIEKVNKEVDKAITDKGIAVISTDKDGKIEQIAEIEKEELVLRLDITKIIEELWKDGSDEAMLKAGKLLVSELMENTDDNTEELLDGDD